jgi:esterase/lipase
MGLKVMGVNDNPKTLKYKVDFLKTHYAGKFLVLQHFVICLKELPILIASGEDDVVGDYGKTPEKLHNKLTTLGYDSELAIYPNLRHEILFEQDKAIVEQDILKFINENKENHF